MTTRPHLTCAHCGHSWYPRGSNRSVKCPACGVKFTHWLDQSPESNTSAPKKPEPLVVRVGCVLVGLGIIVAFVVLLMSNGDKANPVDTTKDNTDLKNPPQPASDTIAPPPRQLDARVPPSGFTSQWVQLGAIRTRVTGVRIERPLLVENGHEFRSPTRCIVVWVETAGVGGTREVRRWLSPGLSFAALQSDPAQRLPPTKFGPGIRPAGQLEGGHKVVPGGPPVVDVLVFEGPRVPVDALFLTLEDEHVGEVGTMRHVIPSSAWN